MFQREVTKNNLWEQKLVNKNCSSTFNEKI